MLCRFLGGSFVDFHATHWIYSHSQLLGIRDWITTSVQSRGLLTNRGQTSKPGTPMGCFSRLAPITTSGREKSLLGAFALQFVFNYISDFCVRLITRQQTPIDE